MASGDAAAVADVVGIAVAVAGVWGRASCAEPSERTNASEWNGGKKKRTDSAAEKRMQVCIGHIM